MNEQPRNLDYAGPALAGNRGRTLFAGVLLLGWFVFDLVAGLVSMLVAFTVFTPANMGAVASLAMLPAFGFGLALAAWSVYTLSCSIGLLRGDAAIPSAAHKACRQAEVASYFLALFFLILPLLWAFITNTRDPLYALIPVCIMFLVLLPAVTLTRRLLRSLVPLEALLD